MNANRLLSVVLTGLFAVAALAAASSFPSSATAGAPAFAQRSLLGWTPTTSSPYVSSRAPASARVRARTGGRAFAVAARPTILPVAGRYGVAVRLRARQPNTRVCVRATTGQRSERTCATIGTRWQTVRVAAHPRRDGATLRVRVTGRARVAGDAFQFSDATVAMTGAVVREFASRCSSRRWRDSCDAPPSSSPPPTGQTSPSAGPVPPPVSPAAGTAAYFRTAPLGDPGIPRSDEECARLVRGSPWEPRDFSRPGGDASGPTGYYGHKTNLEANRRVPSGSWPFGGAFNDARIKGHPAAHQRVVKVSGRFTGTTDEILQWASCKWGLNEDYTRAQAVNESQWFQDAMGDWASSCSKYQSHGILQVRDYMSDCTTRVWGGFPMTRDFTALNADFASFVIRAYYEGWWNHWADTRTAVGSERIARGMWFSGGSHASADNYMLKVDRIRAERRWTDSTWGKRGYPWPVVSG